jgi:hypothetical protein
MALLSNDLARELLLKYEPVLYFDSENKVLPIDSASYVSHCSLWLTPRAIFTFKKPLLVKDWGEIQRGDLAQYVSPPNALYYLRFAQLDEATVDAMGRQGLNITTSHIINEGLKQYAALPEVDRAPTYHGRAFVIDKFLVLQYWFLYPINDFRTSHGGINDHEGDWEGISLFFPHPKGMSVQAAMAEPPVAVTATDSWLPLALLAAAHQGSSARPWEEVPKFEDTHPVFYIARGSHATYYNAGKHFVDQADGLGVKVGPGTVSPWQRVIFSVDSLPGWVTNYDGAWGFFSRDALGGYNGPGGLRQTIKFGWLTGFQLQPRQTWTNPVGEAQLDQG